MRVRFVGIVIGIALLQSCKNPIEMDYDYLVKIRIKSDAAITFTDSSRIKIKLYAHDVGVADVSATNLQTIDTLISSVNGEYIFRFNRDDFDSVKPSSGRGDYEYYFAYTIDINNDGQICIDDYIQDFGKSPVASYSQEESGERVVELYTKKVTEGNCYEF